MLAEAGTGIGKTLGYSPRPGCGRRQRRGGVDLAPTPAPCSGRSTRELGRLYPDPEERRRRVVVRKGRENYLCLLNLQEMLGQAAQLGDGDVVGWAWSRAGRGRPATAT